MSSEFKDVMYTSLRKRDRDSEKEKEKKVLKPKIRDKENSK